MRLFIRHCTRFKFGVFTRCMATSSSIPILKLRDYQIDAIDAVKSAINRGVRRPAFVLATGGGKTVVFSHLISQIPKSDPTRGNKILVLAHKEELIKQAVSTITSINPDLKVEIDMRHLKPTFDSDVIVGSVSTLVRLTRLQKYNPRDFKAIILDECHHATAGSWTKILKYFNADTAASEVVVIGCTATMERSDGASLGSVFDEIVFERNLLTMVENKELVDVRFTSLKMDIDLGSLPTKFNDYETSSLSNLLNSTDTNLLVALSYKKLREQHDFKSTMMFCVDIDHCKTLCGVLQREGVNAQYVTGDTVKHQRKSIVDDFKAGKIEVLCNVQVFTEGTDIPNIDSLFLVRPTKSRPLLVQMIGRGLRLHKGKSHCHVVDIAGTRGTGVQSVPTLFSLPSDYVIHGKTYKELEKEKDEFQKQEELEKEKIRASEEEAIHNKLLTLSKMEEKLMFDFVTVDGFLALESKDIHEFSNSKKLHSRFANDTLPWIRIDYDTWAHNIDDRLFVIERVRETEDTHHFKLFGMRFSSLQQRIASKFQCGKFTTKTELEKSYNLDTILAKACSLSSEINGIIRNQKDGPVTEKQQKYIYEKLKTQVKKYYEDTPEIQQKLRDEVAKLSKKRASLILFAAKYSINTLHNKWELQKMLGPDKKARRAIKKIMKQQERVKILPPKMASDIRPQILFE